ncbi:NSP-interacting kinase 1-like protein [Tanacetum coccineum]
MVGMSSAMLEEGLVSISQREESVGAAVVPPLAVVTTPMPDFLKRRLMHASFQDALSNLDVRKPVNQFDRSIKEASRMMMLLLLAFHYTNITVVSSHSVSWVGQACKGAKWGAKELEERYGQSNGPLIYHVERELSKVSQGSSIVAAYFNKLKKFWDELHSLNGIPMCTCGKLRECTFRNQFMSMDPLPNLNKAYYIVQQVEKQKQVTHQVSDPTAFFAKGNQSVRRDNRNDGRNDNRGQSTEKKVCTHCGQEGHLYEQCFERLGYHDWYKGKKNKKGKMDAQVSSDFSPYMAKETPFDFEYENDVQNGKTYLDQRMVAVVCQEMMKMFKGKGIDPSCIASTSQPHACTYYFGCKPYKILSFHVTLNVLAKNMQLDLRVDWIVDTRASDHMSPHLHLFHSIRVLKRPIKIRLPDETSKWDPSTRKVLVVGQGFNNLYICKPSSDNSVKSTSVPSISVLSSFVNKEANMHTMTLDLFHARLGHTFVSKLIHVDDCKHQNTSQFTCETYLLSKQHMLPFPKSHTKSLLAFELIHVDLWGPYKAGALNGAHYFLPLCMITLDVHGLIKHTSPTHTALTTNQAPPVRRSSRSSTQPAWLKDFVTSKHKAGMAATNNPKTKHPIYPLFQAEDFEQYPAEYVASLANVLAIPEPHEEIYMKPPEGYTKAAPGQVCKLNKSLYGLKHASRQWNNELSKILISLGFIQSKHDYSLFVKAQGEKFTVALVYVDDILLTGNSMYFLGIELCNTAQGTYLHQRKYILDLLQDAGLTSAKPTSFPLPQNLKLALNKGNPINDAESTEGENFILRSIPVKKAALGGVNIRPEHQKIRMPFDELRKYTSSMGKSLVL